MATKLHPIARCQTMSLLNQLEAGVRFLDVRCRHFHRSFLIHHDKVYQGTNFDQVLDVTLEFLSNHPTEVILMRLKKEYFDEGNGDESFTERLDIYLASRDQTKIWRNSSFPETIGDARGKLVILRDIGGTSEFVDYGRFEAEVNII